MNANIASLLYLACGVLFILALRGLSSPVTSRRGNQMGMVGMAIAVAVTLATLWKSGDLDAITLALIVGGVAIGGTIGAVIARRVAMTSMPQLVAAFHSLVGLAACLVATAAIYTPAAYHIDDAGGVKLESLIELSIGLAIGAVTFTGSLIAFAKLNGNMSGAPILLPARHLLNLALGLAIAAMIVILVLSGGHALWAFWVIFALALTAGVTLIIPIGGADMPVVVSMLNSYSGWAAAALGFTLGNITLIITGALVGSSGAILSYIMCKGMNRSFISVILGGFGADDVYGGKIRSTTAEELALLLSDANRVVIVPGYGMAVSQAQHVVRDLFRLLEKRGVTVEFAIHPVAGRMPGHMNVLLAEADIPYERLIEMDTINPTFETVDVAIVIGANDVVNPDARKADSPIAGMPILEVDKARMVVVVKRSLSPGFAGIPNPLFAADNTLMYFADAQAGILEVNKELKAL